MSSIFGFETLDDFKTGFLKRFGNTWVTNKVEKEREYIKVIIYQPKSISELEDTINSRSSLRVKVRIQAQI